MDATLRYVLCPEPEALDAIGRTVDAYAAMFRVLATLPAGIGRNLVTLHDQAYERVRRETSLPARLVTLGLRDFTAYGAAAPRLGLPLDDKLFALKGASALTLATVTGRVAIRYEVAGYAPGRDAVFSARLVAREGRFEIHVAVVREFARQENAVMLQENVLARMGRLIAGIANATIDKAEDLGKVAVVEQAIREIDAAADAARGDLGRAKAEQYRIEARRREIETDLEALESKVRFALSENRDDLAKAAIARQIDLEAQVTALNRAGADARSAIEEGQQALQAVLATRREADARLAELKRSLEPRGSFDATGARGTPAGSEGAARAAAAIARVTGVPGGTQGSAAELDELDRLQRERAIAERLARAKSNG